MQTLQFSIIISATKENVWHTMLDDKTYRQWAAVFMPGSHFKGSWEIGSKIQFLSADENGKMSGMTSHIVENRPYAFISIEHLGLVAEDVEDTTSAEAKEWQGFENYTFKDLGNLTKVVVDIDTKDEFKDYFSEAWPKALSKLKEIAKKP